MIDVIYVKKKRSGFKSRGVNGLPKPTDGLHIDRVLWLVAQLEMPTGFGSIQNCHDAAVMSAGILHHTAVVPKQMLQGSLWKLLARMQVAAGNNANMNRLMVGFGKAGWILGRDGKLRYTETGSLVSGRDIMREITQSEDGNVPESGEEHKEAEAWARAFATAFADPATYETQKAFAAEWLLDSRLHLESTAYMRAWTERPVHSVEAAHLRLPEPVDLAMAVYHAFSANAPSVARQVLTQVLAKTSLKNDEFCRELILKLGTKRYKNWADRDDDRSRYDRTRDAARKLWSPDLVDQMMPENIRRR